MGDTESLDRRRRRPRLHKGFLANFFIWGGGGGGRLPVVMMYVFSGYIEIQGTTPNFCPTNFGILVSGMGQFQGVFGT